MGLDELHRTMANRVLKYAASLGFDADDRRAWWTRTGLAVLVQSAELVYRHLRDDEPDSLHLEPLGRLIARWRLWVRPPVAAKLAKANAVHCADAAEPDATTGAA